MCIGCLKKKPVQGLRGDLESLKNRWTARWWQFCKKGKIRELDDLERELYAFRRKHSHNPDYKSLLVHIKNKLTVDYNIHTETSSIAALLISMAALLVSVNEIWSDECWGGLVQGIVVVLALAGCAVVLIPVVLPWFKNRITEKNFYEICLNILE